MSIYDQRTKPAYRNHDIDISYADSKYILNWWTSEHDQLIINLIDRFQWCWYWEISRSVLGITDSSIIDSWRNEDPICSKYAWSNVLMYFALARAEVLKLTKRIRSPEWKICGLCNKKFVEDSLPFPLIKRQGLDQLEFCAPCLRDTVLSNLGSDTVNKNQIIKFLCGIYEFTGVLPRSDYYVGYRDLLYLDFEDRVRFLKLLQLRPSTARVNELFNSWVHALQQADLIGEYVLRTTRGIHTIANDGHLCLSMGERTIDDFLYEHGIDHEKEPSYPESNYRADFKVGDTYIEYFGLVGDPEYEKRMDEKILICDANKIEMIALFPDDLRNEKRLIRKLLKIMPKS